MAETDSGGTPDRRRQGAGLGIRGKLVLIFVAIKVVPLIALAWFAWQQAGRLAETVTAFADQLSHDTNATVRATGERVVADSVAALDDQAREAIERLTTDTARAIAEFLYGRDRDVRYAATLPRTGEAYRAFLDSRRRAVTTHGRYVMDRDGGSWIPADPVRRAGPFVSAQLEENRKEFHSRPPESGDLRTERPLYLEMTFIGRDGVERIKVRTSDLTPAETRDVSVRANTFVRAERYFEHLPALAPGDIHVSDVIGAYVGSSVIGPYTRARAAEKGFAFAPEESAYAGLENPVGRRFRGLIRWATPVVVDGTVVGWVTLALDHRHVMAFTDPIVPGPERYTRIPDPGSGNYAFVLDHRGRTITHPRNYYIVGYDPGTGGQVVPWLEQPMYEDWKASGLSFEQWSETVPTFHRQSKDRKPAMAQVKAGTVAADCRFLNFAPQCAGWYNLTRHGGSGSFQIFWSGLWKLNTAAPIPYFTGPYGATPRGFGIVTIGANVDDFHRAAKDSGDRVAAVLAAQTDALAEQRSATAATITASLAETTRNLVFSTLVMVGIVVLIALWMSRAVTRRVLLIADGMGQLMAGRRGLVLPDGGGDEIGTLTGAFNDLAATLERQEGQLSKLSTAVEQSPASVIITDTDGAIEYVNPKFTAATGYARDEVLGENPRILKSGEMSPAAYEALWATITSGQTWSGEFHNKRKDGTLFWENASISPIRDDAGKVTSYIAIKEDITESKRAATQLRDSEARLRSILDNSPAVVYLKDAACRYVVVNHRFEEVTGLSGEAILGKTDFDVFPTETAEAFRANDRAVLETGAAVHLEETAPLADGPHTYLSVKFPVFDAEGAVAGVCGISTDITERKQVERELARSNQELEQFAYVSSHDLQEPLRMVTSYLQLLERRHGEQLDGEARELLNYAVDGAKRMTQLIRDLLEFSRVKTHGGEFQPVPLGDPVDTALVHLALQVHSSGATVTTDLPDATVPGDTAQLTQLFQNLIGNAVKYADPDRPPEVHVAAERAGGDWRFSVSDNGIGIEPQYFERIFIIFQRLHSRTEYSGTGIGLAVCKRIVERHGGRIWVESVPGEGTTFRFTLPAEG